MVWEHKYEIIMMYIWGINIIFMKYKTRYLCVQMKCDIFGWFHLVTTAGSYVLSLLVLKHDHYQSGDAHWWSSQYNELDEQRKTSGLYFNYTEKNEETCNTDNQFHKTMREFFTSIGKIHCFSYTSLLRSMATCPYTHQNILQRCCQCWLLKYIGWRLLSMVSSVTYICIPSSNVRVTLHPILHKAVILCGREGSCGRRTPQKLSTASFQMDSLHPNHQKNMNHLHRARPIGDLGNGTARREQPDLLDGGLTIVTHWVGSTCARGSCFTRQYELLLHVQYEIFSSRARGRCKCSVNIEINKIITEIYIISFI